MIRTLLSIIVSLHGLGVSTNADSPERVMWCAAVIDGIQLDATIPLENRLGESITVLLSLKNGSPEDVGYLDTSPTFIIEVRDNKGNIVPLTAVGRKEAVPSPDPREATLRSGATISGTVDLAQWFTLTSPGSYSVSVRRSVNEMNHKQRAALYVKNIDFAVGEPTTDDER